MASTYKIYFTNWSGASTNFAFFSAVPVVNNNGGSPVYGNIIASQYVPADNGDTTFEIDVTQTYYAWTSVCPVDVSKLPGTNIVTKISNSKLATLGTKGAPGSTFKLIDNGGNPTFDPASTTFAAPDGTFQITSDANAFQPDQNFICGLGSVDGNGQRIPVATFAAQPNTVATIKPIVTFYIAQFSSQTGTVIDVSILSNKAAQIDFTGKGVNAAFVKQTQGGGFDVRYGSAKAMLELSKSSSSQKDPENSSLSQSDVGILMDILQKLKPVPNTLYQCGFDWVDGLSEEAKAQAVNRAATAMNNPPGYIVASVPGPPFTYPSFGIESPNTRDVVADRWSNVVANQLAAEARNPYTVDGNFAKSKAQDTPTNGNQVTNKQSNGTNGLANNDLVQLLKGMRGLDVAAY